MTNAGIHTEFDFDFSPMNLQDFFVLDPKDQQSLLQKGVTCKIGTVMNEQAIISTYCDGTVLHMLKYANPNRPKMENADTIRRWFPNDGKILHKGLSLSKIEKKDLVIDPMLNVSYYPTDEQIQKNNWIAMAMAKKYKIHPKYIWKLYKEPKVTDLPQFRFDTFGSYNFCCFVAEDLLTIPVKFDEVVRQVTPERFSSEDLVKVIRPGIVVSRVMTTIEEWHPDYPKDWNVRKDIVRYYI